MSEQKPVYINKTVLTTGAALTALIMVMGGIMWLTTMFNAIQELRRNQDKSSAVISALAQNTEKDTTRISILETQYALILTGLRDVQGSVDKLSEKFNIK